MTRATFRIPEPRPDAIDFVLTAKERAHAAWGSVHLEAVRRERNHRDALAEQAKAERAGNAA